MTVSVCTAKWSNVHTDLVHRTMPGARLVHPKDLLMERAPVVPARALLPWVFEVVHPEDLVPLTGFKARVRVFRGRVLRMQANPEVLRTVLVHRAMRGARLVRPKDLLMEQGPIIARDLLAQALATRGIRSKVSAENRSSDEVYWEGTFENPYLLIQ